MRQIYIIIILMISLKGFCQDKDSLVFTKNTVMVGLGVGTKSQLGNIGITSNYFLTKNINISLSLGFGPLNYNGGILSFGPEYLIHLKKRISFLIGTTYAISSSTSGDIETHNSDKPHYNVNSGGQYLRSYTGLCFKKNRRVTKIEVGYSYAIKTPNYNVTGLWKPEYSKNLESGISSGLLVTLSIQFAKVLSFTVKE